MTFPSSLQTDDLRTGIAAAEALRASSTAVYISDRSKASQSKQIQAFEGYSRERVTRAYAVRVYMYVRAFIIRRAALLSHPTDYLWTVLHPSMKDN
ncbi:MAG: hypothetical protein IJU35_05070 [Paludibacteraceae bacterium]|nr:hypothetical protein [Paludibacteraceae bacterium]